MVKEPYEPGNRNTRHNATGTRTRSVYLEVGAGHHVSLKASLVVCRRYTSYHHKNEDACKARQEDVLTPKQALQKETGSQ